MAAAAVITNISKTGNVGAMREFWIKVTKSDGTALSADASGNCLLYYVANPFGRDVAIMKTIANITTVGANDGDIDIGFSNASDGTGKAADIVDSLINITNTGPYDCTDAGDSTDGTKILPVWKAALTATTTDSWLTIFQNASADASALQWTLLLKCVFTEDMV